MNYDDITAIMGKTQAEVPHGQPKHDQPVADRRGHSVVPDPGSAPNSSVGFASPEERLAVLLKEYHYTQRVVAVLVERLLAHQDRLDTELVLTEEVIFDCPDLNAYKDEATGNIHLSVQR